MSRTTLKKILNKLDGTNDTTLGAIRDFENGVKTLREKLQQEIEASTLQEVNQKINKLRKSIDLEPLLSSVQSLEQNFKTSILSILNDLEVNNSKLKNITNFNTDTEYLSEEITGLRDNLSKVVANNNLELSNLNTKLAQILKESGNYVSKVDFGVALADNQKVIAKLEKKTDEEVTDLKDELDKTRLNLLAKLAEKGGGNMNRQILVGGNPSTLGKYTDINLKAGSNVTITYSSNDTTKRTDITISSSGGGSSVAGTVRSINNINTSQTAGNTSGTDYVYICSAGINLTLPTALTNTNQYTIKNISTSSVLISRDGADTIESDTSLILATQYTSVDLISNQTSNWNIT